MKFRKPLNKKQINQPIDKSYVSQALMLADQASQEEGFIYYDGTSHWEKLTASTGLISNYRVVGGVGGGDFDGNPSSLNQEGATDGQAIVWNNIAGEWQPANVAADITAEDGLKKIGTVITLGDNETLFFTPISAPGAKDGVLMLLGSLEIDDVSGTQSSKFEVYNTGSYPRLRFVGTLTAGAGDTLTSQLHSGHASGRSDFYAAGTHQGGREARFAYDLRNTANLPIGDSLEMFLTKSAGQFLRLRFTGDGTTYSAIFTDSINSKGIEYASDYSANFTANSLITKAYVDGANTTAGAGLSKTGNEIKLGDAVTAYFTAKSGGNKNGSFKIDGVIDSDYNDGVSKAVYETQYNNGISKLFNISDFLDNHALGHLASVTGLTDALRVSQYTLYAENYLIAHYAELDLFVNNTFARSQLTIRINNDYSGLFMASNDRIKFADPIFLRGAGDAADYSATKEDLDYVTKLMLDAAIEATLRENNSVLFDKDYIIGNAAFRTGNITFDFTGAKLGATVVMRHQDIGAFTIPTEAKTLAGEYDGAVDNYLWFVLTDKTAATEIVQLTISQIQP